MLFVNNREIRAGELWLRVRRGVEEALEGVKGLLSEDDGDKETGREVKEEHESLEEMEVVSESEPESESEEEQELVGEKGAWDAETAREGPMGVPPISEESEDMGIGPCEFPNMGFEEAVVWEEKGKVWARCREEDETPG